MSLLTIYVTNSFSYSFFVDGIFYNILQGNTVEVTHDRSSYYSGDIVIPPTVTYNGHEYTVTAIGNYAFSNSGSFAKSKIKSISLPNTITNIGLKSFEGSEINILSLPESVNEIKMYAFSGCSSQKTIVIPQKVKIINEGVFEGCSSLTSITIPNSVTTIFL